MLPKELENFLAFLKKTMEVATEFARTHKDASSGELVRVAHEQYAPTMKFMTELFEMVGENFEQSGTIGKLLAHLAIFGNISVDTLESMVDCVFRAGEAVMEFREQGITPDEFRFALIVLGSDTSQAVVVGTHAREIGTLLDRSNLSDLSDKLDAMENTETTFVKAEDLN